MQSTLLASGLGFPEGPAVMGDGRIVLCDGNTGELLAYADGTHVALRPHRRLAVGHRARHGRRHLRDPGRQRPGQRRHQRRVRHPAGQPGRDRGAAVLRGGRLRAVRPERLGVRPRRAAVLHRVGVRAGLPLRRPLPGRLFAVSRRVGAGEMLLERPGVYPNGIAFDAAGPVLLDRVEGAPGLPAGRTASRRRSASCPTGTCPTAWPSPPTAGCSSPPRSPAGSP